MIDSQKWRPGVTPGPPIAGLYLSILEPSVAQPPLPLQEFLPLQPLSPLLQPPWPLQSFWPLQACLPLSSACSRLAMLELRTEVWFELGTVEAFRVTVVPVIRRDFTVFFVISDSFSIEIWDRFRGTDRASWCCRVPSSWDIRLPVPAEVTFFPQKYLACRLPAPSCNFCTLRESELDWDRLPESAQQWRNPHKRRRLQDLRSQSIPHAS